jgi:hypothetical protein
VSSMRGRNGTITRTIKHYCTIKMKRCMNSSQSMTTQSHSNRAGSSCPGIKTSPTLLIKIFCLLARSLRISEADWLASDCYLSLATSSCMAAKEASLASTSACLALASSYSSSIWVLVRLLFEPTFSIITPIPFCTIRQNS